MIIEVVFAAAMVSLTAEEAESILTARLWMTAGLGAAATLLFILFGQPVEKFVERIQPDADKRYRFVWIAGIMFFSVIGAIMSILIMLRLLGVAALPGGE